MKFLAIEHEVEGVKAEDFAPFLDDEATHLWKLSQAGIVREVYFTENHEAVLILECENVETARYTLNQFPLVKNKLIYFELKTLNPYDGFERLFKD